MSSSGVLDVVLDTVGSVSAPMAAIGTAVAITTGVVAVAAVGAVALPVAAVYGIGRAVYGAGHSAFNEAKSLINSKKIYSDALQQYEKAIQDSAQEKEEYISKLKSAINPIYFSISDNDFLTDLNDTDELINLLSIQNTILAIDELLDNLQHEDIELKAQSDFYSLLMELKDKLQNKQYNIKNYRERFLSLLTDIKNELRSEKNKDLFKKVDTYITKVHDYIDLPAILLFHNELRDLICKIIKEDEDKEKELIIREEKINELVVKCDSISHPCAALNEFIEILIKVKNQLSDMNLSLEDKIKLCDLHYHWLMDSYLKIQKEYQWFETTKKQFDDRKEYYVNCCRILNVEPKDHKFDFENCQKSIDSLEADMNSVKQKAEDVAKVNVTLKSIADVMRRNNFKHLVSSQCDSKEGKVWHEVYHLENGNVVAFFVTEKGIRYNVSGVRLDGFDADIYSIMQSQTHMCEVKKEIEKLLMTYGFDVRTKQLIKPEDKYAKEIALKDVSFEEIEFLKKQKRHQASQSKKSRYLGD